MTKADDTYRARVIDSVLWETAFFRALHGSSEEISDIAINDEPVYARRLVSVAESVANEVVWSRYPEERP